MQPSAHRQAPLTRPDAGQASSPNRRDARPGSRPAVVASGVVLLLGVWLVIAAFLWNRGDGAGIGAGWFDFGVGLIVAVIALFRVLAPSRTGPLGVVTIILGLWLIAAPFVLDYGSSAEATAATWNSCIAGVLIAVLATLSSSATLGARRSR